MVLFHTWLPSNGPFSVSPRIRALLTSDQLALALTVSKSDGWRWREVTWEEEQDQDHVEYSPSQLGNITLETAILIVYVISRPKMV